MVTINSSSGLACTNISDFHQKHSTSLGTIPWWQVWWTSVRRVFYPRTSSALHFTPTYN